MTDHDKEALAFPPQRGPLPRPNLVLPFRDNPAVKKEDPAFLYFPTNYRWSMGLLICLSGAPWTGVEIDEVNRVGRALAGEVGDDTSWFEEWSRMGGKIEEGRPRAPGGVVLYAGVALLSDRRALDPSALAAPHGRLCEVSGDIQRSRR